MVHSLAARGNRFTNTPMLANAPSGARLLTDWQLSEVGSRSGSRHGTHGTSLIVDEVEVAEMVGQRRKKKVRDRGRRAEGRKVGRKVEQVDRRQVERWRRRSRQADRVGSRGVVETGKTGK